MKMNRTLQSLVPVALAVVALSGCAASREQNVTRWALRDAARVGGHATQIVGSPGNTGADGAALVFDGEADGIFVPVNPLANWRAFTIEVRFRPDGSGHEEQRFLHLEDELRHRVLMETRVREQQWSLDTFLFQDAGHKLTLLDRAKQHPTDRWYWVALVYDGVKMSSYVNGVLELSGEVDFPPMVAGRTSIGVRQNRVSWFKGAIAEIRFTPRALPADRLRASP
ncbi:MAG TPA: LamG domain-containing protein [Steroidobacteraceae bacterium]|nr:LamG domain-containing protein [Steroidobacteraceae bacterium]